MPFALLASLSAVPSFAAGGTLDWSAFTTVAGGFVGIILIVAAVATLACFATAIFKFVGHNWMQGVGYVLGTMAGGIVVGYALTWTQSLTGVTVPTQ